MTSVQDNIHAILAVCSHLTQGYDVSHDVNHHIKVYDNCREIMRDEITTHNLSDDDKQSLEIIVAYSALLHDTIDAKYPKGLEDKMAQLHDFLVHQVPNECEAIEWVINHMSYSKEVKTGRPYHFNCVINLARSIVSDADKLEAIGEIGITRCREYIVAKFGTTGQQLTDEIVAHCHEKLLKIPSFLVTDRARAMAEPLNQEIVKYVKTHAHMSSPSPWERILEVSRNNPGCTISYDIKVFEWDNDNDDDDDDYETEDIPDKQIVNHNNPIMK